MSVDALLCARCSMSILQPRIDTSFLQAKLSSEFGPTTLSTQEIHSWLLSCDKDMEDCNLEISRLQSQLLCVEKQKETLRGLRVKLSSLDPPTIHRIPNEILLRIFEFVCKKNLFKETHDAQSSLYHLPALVVSAVCSRWRSLALSSPSFWSKLFFELDVGLLDDGIPLQPSPRLMSTLQLYLQRSTDYPLCISMEVGEGGDFNQLFSLLLEECRRWRSFSFSHTSGIKLCDQKPFCHWLVQLHFPMLEELNVKEDADCELFWDSPRLYRLDVYGVRQPSRLPLTSITTLAIIAQSTHILDVFPNVTSLTLWQPSTGLDLGMLYKRPRSSTKLSSFTLVLLPNSSDLLESSFLFYILPALISLHIRSWGSEHAWPNDAFNVFLKASQCKITSLSIHRVMGISDLDVIHILQALPFIEDLSLSDCSLPETKCFITSHLISQLQSQGVDEHVDSLFQSPLIPHLRYLRLVIGGKTTIDDTLLAKTISSRWVPDARRAASARVTCLRSVVVRFCARIVDQNSYGPLVDHLDEMGMRIVIIGKGRTGLRRLLHECICEE